MKNPIRVFAVIDLILLGLSFVGLILSLLFSKTALVGLCGAFLVAFILVGWLLKKGASSKDKTDKETEKE